jgi:hypothetical protein
VPLLIPRSPTVLVAPSLQVGNRESTKSTETETPFEIPGVPPGSYYIYGVTSDGLGGPQWVRTAIEVGTENVNDITIVLSTPGTVKGRLRIASDAVDADQFDFSKLTFSVAFSELTIALVGGLPPVGLNKAGEFQFERLAEANVFLRPSYLDDGWFISEMQLDGKDVMGSGFASKPGRESTVEVTISNAGGVIAGIIKDRQDKPLRSARFVLLPEVRLRGNPVLLKTGVANANGDFTINAIRPGNYTLLAFPGRGRVYTGRSPRSRSTREVRSVRSSRVDWSRTNDSGGCDCRTGTASLKQNGLFRV